MKKQLVLIPTIVVTVLLALAFILPASAAGVLRAASPAFHAALPASVSSAVEFRTAQAGNTSTARASTVAAKAKARPSEDEEKDDDHGIATGGHENCGHDGDGDHGGKHEFVCKHHKFSS